MENCQSVGTATVLIGSRPYLTSRPSKIANLASSVLEAECTCWA
jgi:hypothetical protein